MTSRDEALLLELLALEPTLRSYLRRYATQPADVDDLVQGVYERLLTIDACTAVGIRSVRAFALTSARNLALDWHRHRRVVPIRLVEENSDLDVLDERVRVVDAVAAQQELKYVQAAIEALPVRCREVFVMRKVQGYTQKEIAARLSISEHTVEQHLVKAVKRLCLVRAALDVSSDSEASDAAHATPRLREA